GVLSQHTPDRLQGGQVEVEDQAGEHGEDECPEAEQRGERVDPTKTIGMFSGGLSSSHSPLILSRALMARRSRRASATSAGRPFTEESVVAEAVLSLTVFIPRARSMGPAVTSTNWMRP